MKYLNSLEKFGMRLGLARITKILEDLGNPQNQLKCFHVAGTNGKGSTCATIASILQAGGYRVGLFTSPHLLDYRERFQINGRQISRTDWQKGLRLVRRAAEKTEPQAGRATVFEVLTALAFWYFAQNKVDYAVIEVGLGGRLDATNVLTPLVTVITNVELEHTSVLGDSLAKIAREKGGIIKAGVPVVTAEKKASPLKVIKTLCRRNGSRLIIAHTKQPLVDSRLKLFGPHQKLNALCAIQAVASSGVRVTNGQLLRGLSSVSWPGRMQVLSHHPLTIVDGAHNPAGASALVAALKQLYAGRRFIFILGMQKDKDTRAFVRHIKPLAKMIIPVRSTNQQARVMIAGKKAQSLKGALAQTVGTDRIITGSLYLVGDALRLLDVKI
ncbi:hypothetical protein A2311_02305 [candidate division WOR-1 bacterium RIFOXYB2_FULL_48_7]|uniref:tetrahydrofolate synthase n=1 Tax=candidate division WOR-1 bacterium RIFOXYB2_FULL_48_7 TaxID=1802583 RepID=A0A1F4TM08_UNCSA|nr:MAG: hypothetical protein A2311_02305 [candidate division WOR-1 bacterium RIFOXYB2_FULL_48_7]